MSGARAAILADFLLGGFFADLICRSDARCAARCSDFSLVGRPRRRVGALVVSDAFAACPPMSSLSSSGRLSGTPERFVSSPIVYQLAFSTLAYSLLNHRADTRKLKSRPDEALSLNNILVSCVCKEYALAVISFVPRIMSPYPVDVNSSKICLY